MIKQVLNKRHPWSIGWGLLGTNIQPGGQCIWDMRGEIDSSKQDIHVIDGMISVPATRLFYDKSPVYRLL
jgi:hypothetical protein